MHDRHFDALSSRFASKIYGSAKGAIRLAVLQADLDETLPKRPLRILDVGAGQGQMALWLARQGHHLTLAEPAAPMLDIARQQFQEAGLAATFLQVPWQDLHQHLQQPFDLVLCHAVLEWLGQPQDILPELHRLTDPNGWLSLAFYNQDALVYRNLLKGHFRKLQRQQFAGEGQSLTPQRPIDPQVLDVQLARDWRVEARSGIRVFHDYMPADFQSKADPEQLIAMELAYRRHPTFSGLGRYLHWICRPVDPTAC